MSFGTGSSTNGNVKRIQDGYGYRCIILSSLEQVRVALYLIELEFRKCLN